MTYTVEYEGKQYKIVGHAPDEYISSYLAKGQFYEEPLLSFIRRTTWPPAKLIVDVGANIGNHSVFFEQVLGADVVSFEPNQENYRRLKKNASNTHNVALGAKNGTVGTVNNPSNMGASYCIPGGDIECRTLDSYDLAPDLIKIDAENMEVDVIKGATETIREHAPTLVVEHHDIQHLYDFYRSLPIPYVIHPFVEKTWEMFIYVATKGH